MITGFIYPAFLLCVCVCAYFYVDKSLKHICHTFSSCAERLDEFYVKSGLLKDSDLVGEQFLRDNGFLAMHESYRKISHDFCIEYSVENRDLHVRNYNDGRCLTLRCSTIEALYMVLDFMGIDRQFNNNK